jgi:UDP-3-O-[3-hydroxymyristoyl] glucosamine N-acyltransferase
MSKTFSVKEITNNLNCYFIGDNKIVKGISTLQNATEDHISFFCNNKYRKWLSKTNAGVCIIKSTDANLLPPKITKIIADDPYLAYACVLDMFYPEIEIDSFIASSAFIANTAKIGKGCTINHNVVIEDGVLIGDNSVIGVSTYIGKNVTIGNKVTIASNVSLIECEIGDECIIHSGVRIGQDGFGFTLDTQKHIKKIKQIGKVIIGKNVEIGSNTCIDRGALDNTIVGDNTKIDNLVQIGHNVVIGKNCFICGQAGIAGSTKVGDYVMIGGQAGLNGHIEIGNMVQIAGHSGVINDLEDGVKVGGYPAMNIFDWHKQTIFLKKAI